MSSRVTRSKSRHAASNPTVQQLDSCTRPVISQTNVPTTPSATYTFLLSPKLVANLEKPTSPLPSKLTKVHTKLDPFSHQLLLLKQRKLRALDLVATHARVGRYLNRSTAANQADLLSASEDTVTRHAVASTLIFASDSAGTAVSIHESGLVLTCAHCVAESREQYDDEIVKANKVFWLLTARGDAVRAVCVAWDEKRDLALLKVIAFQQSMISSAVVGTPLNGQVSHITTADIGIASSMPTKKSPVLCIGHPGSEDLEAETEGVKTCYPVLTISEGHYLGYAKRQDIQDNNEIGALMHTAWTYWGHSGAPIIDARSGHLIGLHSSWDAKNGTRRGVGVEAIHDFLKDVEAGNGG